MGTRLVDLDGLRFESKRVARRFVEELTLLCHQLHIISAAVVFLAYCGYMLFRNLAFYRFQPGPRLPDLGHELIPTFGKKLHQLGEVPMYVLYILIATMLLATLHDSERANKPYVVNMFRRFVCVLALGHALRFVSYIGTSLPGAADHCMPENVVLIQPPQPKTVADVFTRYAASPGGNCGDLVFSGHMLQAILFGLIICRYGQRCYNISHRMNVLLRALTAFLVATQAVFVIAARNHYTVDIVVACYTTPFLWYWYGRAVQPHDLELATKLPLRRTFKTGLWDSDDGEGGSAAILLSSSRGIPDNYATSESSESDSFPV